MSPVVMLSLVEQLQAELQRCLGLCRLVRANRRISRAATHLSALEGALQAGRANVRIDHDAARRRAGSRLDLGDARARAEMDAHLALVRRAIRARLEEVSMPSSLRINNATNTNNNNNNYYSNSYGGGGVGADGGGGGGGGGRKKGEEKENPGFKEMLKTWTETEARVRYTMEDLAQRIRGQTPPLTTAAASSTGYPSPSSGYMYGSSPTSPTSASSASSSYAGVRAGPETAGRGGRDSSGGGSYVLLRADQVVVGKRQVEALMEHMRNSWTGRYVGGDVMYVNKLDEGRMQWQRPTGGDVYIREAPPRLAQATAPRRGSWDRRSPLGSSVTESWESDY